MSAGRLERRFEDLGRESRCGFIPYVMAGDPDPGATLAILRALVDAGADVIELGLPFSDPVADGPSIERAARRALSAGMTATKVLDIVRAFRELDPSTPLVLMGYLNPLLAFGLDRFAEAMAEAGADGAIVVDCPPEESTPLLTSFEARDLALIRLATPTSDDARLERISRGGRGFLYYVSVTGVTGGQGGETEAIGRAVVRARRISGLPVAVGFGVRQPSQAAAIARFADAAVVGSALVEAIERTGERGEDAAVAAAATARPIAEAIRRARTKLQAEIV